MNTMTPSPVCWHLLRQKLESCRARTPPLPQEGSGETHRRHQRQGGESSVLMCQIKSIVKHKGEGRADSRVSSFSWRNELGAKPYSPLHKGERWMPWTERFYLAQGPERRGSGSKSLTGGRCPPRAAPSVLCGGGAWGPKLQAEHASKCGNSGSHCL